MAFLTNEKLTIVGAAGMIGSNMVQTALTMGLTSDICRSEVYPTEARFRGGRGNAPERIR